MSCPRNILAVAVLAVAWPLAACSVSSAPGTGAAPAVSSAGPAQPDTAAAAKTAAQEFMALYSAGQWSAAWQYLTPADKAKIPESLYTAFHDGCPSKSAGLAYEIQDVTLAGPTAVITYTIPVLAKLGSATMAMAWVPAGWGVSLDASALKDYTHGSAKADIASARKTGECSAG